MDLRQLVSQEPVALAATLDPEALVALDLRLHLVPATTEETVAVAATAETAETAAHQGELVERAASEATLEMEALAAPEVLRRMVRVERLAQADLSAAPATQGCLVNLQACLFYAVTASSSERSPAHLLTDKCQPIRRSCTAVCAHRTRDARAESIAN